MRLSDGNRKAIETNPTANELELNKSVLGFAKKARSNAELRGSIKLSLIVLARSRPLQTARVRRLLLPSC